MSNPDGAPYDPEALGTEREQYPDPESYPPPETPAGETRTAETPPMNVPGEETTDGSVPDPDITGADTDGQT